jgi:dual specificity protein phosphatase-like protein
MVVKIYHIIPGKLYQSAYTHQLGDDQLRLLLKEFRITMIVNLWSKKDPRIEELGLRYLHVPLSDGQVRSDTIEKAIDIANAINLALAKEECILIHCRGGRNRASFISGLTLYIRGMTGAQAAAVVCAVRPRAFSNQNFQKYLEGL